MDASGRHQHKNIQGGHGNGGKCYMINMFEDHSYFHTVRTGRRNCYGVTAGSTQFGYNPSRAYGRDRPITSVQEELRKALSPIRFPYESISNHDVRDIVERAEGFTLIRGVKPKEYGKKIPSEDLLQALLLHEHMVVSMQFCRLFLVINGTMRGERLAPPEIEPLPGGESPRIVPIPAHLHDPDTHQRIPTRADDSSFPHGELRLLTSKLRMTHKKRPLHKILFYSSDRDLLGAVPVSELGVVSTYSQNIYGSCQLDTLEPFKQNDRGRLAEAPLTRAVRDFISRNVKEYAEEFEKRDRREIDEKSRHRMLEVNDILNRWKDRFIREHITALIGKGDGDNEPPGRTPRAIGKPVRMDAKLSHQYAGIGVSIKPTLAFYAKKGVKVQNVPYTWVIDDTNIAMPSENGKRIITFSPGSVRIHAETTDGLKSNTVVLEVVRVRDINISPSQIDIPRFSNGLLVAECVLDSGVESSDIYLEWTENDAQIAQVTPAGRVFALKEGRTEITAEDDFCSASSPAIIVVTKGTGDGAGDSPGQGYPQVLISGHNDDPITGEPLHLNRDHPPLFQRPQDETRNIWWINSTSPLASLYRDIERGYGEDSPEWRHYHLERIMEMLFQFTLLNQATISGEAANVDDLITRWGDLAIQIQADAVETLDSFLSGGGIPKNVLG